MKPEYNDIIKALGVSADDVVEFFDCLDADVDSRGNVWIQTVNGSKFLSEDQMIDLVTYKEQELICSFI